MDISSYLTGRRGVSLPFTDYCDPIINHDIAKDNIFSFIIEHAKKLRWKNFEIRGGDTFFSHIKPSSSFYGHTLELSEDLDKLFSGLSKNTKRNVRKAHRENNLQIHLSQSLESMASYFNLHCLTRKRHGLPPPPFYFFKKIHEHVMSKNLGTIFLASYNNNIVGGAVYFHFGDKVIYKYGASNLDYKEVRPNNLIMWEAIKWFSQNGFKQLCMGRTEPENSGLRRFKDGWGAEETMINYYKYEVKTESFVHTQDMVNHYQKRLISKIPKPILTALGSKLYKYVG
jgi:lipid II:glycine glycyltransferase (peptidoglycan interpeptide bridge formation enzyme)